jgi:hypothetical protein
MTSEEPVTEGADSAGTSATELITVHVLGLPLALQEQAQEQTSELTRELTLIGIRLQQQGSSGELPVRLLALIDQLTGRYSSFTAAQEQQLVDAVGAGLETVDLVYEVPASVALAARALSDILDEADEYCRAGRHLLTLATPDELVTYRRWFLDQFIDQAAGRPPVRWADDQRERQG